MTMIFDGQTYELPKFTLSVADKINTVYAAEKVSVRDSYKGQYAFVVDMLGKDNATQALGASGINDCDLNTLTILFNEIEKAMRKPIADYNSDAANATMNDPSVQKLVAIGGSVKNIADVVKMQQK